MKLQIKTKEKCDVLIGLANQLFGYPNLDNGTLIYTVIPEITEIKDGEGVIIDSYYEIEVSSELHEQFLKLLDMTTERVLIDTNTTDYEPEKRFEVKGKDKDYLKLLEAVPELAVYRKQTNLVIHKEKGYQIFYTDAFLAGHRELLEQYFGVNAITDRQNGNE